MVNLSHELLIRLTKYFSHSFLGRACAGGGGGGGGNDFNLLNFMTMTTLAVQVKNFKYFLK
jgi:hypothetical protein